MENSPIANMLQNLYASNIEEVHLLGKIAQNTSDLLLKLDQSSKGGSFATNLAADLVGASIMSKILQKNQQQSDSPRKRDILNFKGSSVPEKKVISLPGGWGGLPEEEEVKKTNKPMGIKMRHVSEELLDDMAKKEKTKIYIKKDDGSYQDFKHGKTAKFNYMDEEDKPLTLQEKKEKSKRKGEFNWFKNKNTNPGFDLLHKKEKKSFNWSKDITSKETDWAIAKAVGLAFATAKLGLAIGAGGDAFMGSNMQGFKKQQVSGMGGYGEVLPWGMYLVTSPIQALTPAAQLIGGIYQGVG